MIGFTSGDKVSLLRVTGSQLNPLNTDPDAPYFIIPLCLINTRQFFLSRRECYSSMGLRPSKTKISSFSSPSSSFFPTAWIFLFFFFFYIQTFQRISTYIFQAFCSFWHSLVAVRNFSSTLTCCSALCAAVHAILLFWRHIALVPVCLFYYIFTFYE